MSESVRVHRFLAALAALPLFLSACSQEGGNGPADSSGGQTSGDAARDSGPLGGSKADATPAPPARQQAVIGTPVQPAAQVTAQPQPAVAQPAFTPPDQPGTGTPTASDEERRAQAENMIYATIRLKMEEAIAKRADLLKNGVSRSDEQVRSLEGTIMRARDLLTEAGEIVEEVDPPIVESQPKQPPAP
jgi:hypothetical protein